MKPKRSFCVSAVLALLASLAIGVVGASSASDELGLAAPAGTAFSYQGQLRDGSGPVNATCDLQFTLWDAGEDGAQVGNTNLLEGMLLQDGLFTARLDFGAPAFQGQARYLEVAASCPAGSAYVTLAPRQELTGSPYALYALAAPWTGLHGVPAGFADGVDNDTTYTAGAGLVLDGTEFRVNRAETQWRVSETCAAGSSIRAIDVDGAVTCEPDTDTIYTAGTGLSLVSGQFSVDFAGSGTAATASRSDHNHDATYVNEGQANSVSTGMVQNSTLLLEDLNQNGCSAGQVIKWNGSAWVCAGDETGGTNFWLLTGNAGTTPGTNYLGTNDNQALEVRVNNARALRIEPNTDSPNLIGGHSANDVTDGVFGATIGGGGGSSFANRVTDNYGTVGGGNRNRAGDDGGTLYSAVWATVGGGTKNAASADAATVGGGYENIASEDWATVGGGLSNTAGGRESTIGGGTNNTASGPFATIAGGLWNEITDTALYATISGGYDNAALANYATIAGGGSSDSENPDATGNRVTDAYGTIGGGGSNQAGNADGNPEDAAYATVGGGRRNTASGDRATVGGGDSNTASGGSAAIVGGYENIASANSTFIGGGVRNHVTDGYGTVAGGYQNRAGDNAGTPDDRLFATVGGGRDNTASGTSSVVAGGDTNTASGDRSTVPGGVGNVAAGHHSFAAGRRAKANHSGAFVWADDLNVDFASTNSNTFRVRATNGAEFVANNAGYGLIAANNGAGDGLRAMTNSSAGDNWAAVYAVSNGTSPAVYANSAGTFSGYFLDNIYVDGNCVGCTTVFLAYNDGKTALESGDLVAANGVQAPLLGNRQPTLAVGLAGGDGAGAIGVVLSRAAVVTGEKDGVESQSVSLVEGHAAPGEYLFVVVQGFAQVKVEASGGAILPGHRLTAGRQAGYARALETREIDGMVVAEGAPVIGVALAAPEPGSDLIPVFVNLQ